MSTNNYFYTLFDIQKLEDEKASLEKAYEAAIENNLAFSKTKLIFLRLKNTEAQLQHLLQKQSNKTFIMNTENYIPREPLSEMKEIIAHNEMSLDDLNERFAVVKRMDECLKIIQTQKDRFEKRKY